MSRLGDELKRLRIERGLTLEEASNNIGITRQYLSMLEKGERKAVSFEIMTNIANYYAVPLDYMKNFVDDSAKELTPEELNVWNMINKQTEQEIYYKSGTNSLLCWFKKKFMGNQNK